tara:strand:- start:383 stop:673 length:291 start_codon:yes stop_codon:yes gene_type:complete
MINKWKKILELDDWVIHTEAIRKEQVQYPDDLELKEFVGISINHDDKYGLINHTRDLTDFDVIHELLHCKWPTMSEDAVNHSTNIILNNEKLDKKS